LYDRLRHIERILGVSLDAAESRCSLHVALLATAMLPGRHRSTTRAAGGILAPW
jgi:hypothetical protein